MKNRDEDKRNNAIMQALQALILEKGMSILLYSNNF